MNQMLYDIKKLAGEDMRRLVLPIVLSVFDACLNSGMYGVMLFLLLALAEGNFDKRKLICDTVVLLVLFFLRCVVQAVSFTGAQCVGPDVTKKLRLRIGNHLRKLNMGYFGKNSIGALSGVLLSDINEFEAILTHCLCDTIKVSAFTTLSVAFAFCLHWKFGLALLFLVLLALPLLFVSGKVSARQSDTLRTANQEVTSRIVEYVEGIRTFRLYHLAGKGFDRLDRALVRQKKASEQAEISILPVTLAFSTVTSMLVPVALLLGTWLLATGQVEKAVFLLILLLSVSVSSMLGTASSLYPQIRSIQKATDHIKAVLLEQPFSYEKEQAAFENYDIAFSHVDFSYEDTIPVLKDISFLAKQGTVTALIGPSGSGKTTVVSLLARFWDVKSGKITVGGCDIKKIAPDELLRHMSIVFQDVYLLSDTVLNNIRIGKSDATREEIIRAAKQACCHEFVEKMEHGYDTVISEGGASLSGGEKQRISIARALLKDAPIVLLDETTSNLDADHEKEIERALARLTKNKTVLVIAHRLGTIKNADQILVLKEGRIKESGNHEKLVAQDGWYRAMYEEQCQAGSWKVKGEND